MKKITWMSLIMIPVFIFMAALPGAAAETALQRTITVTGEAEVNVVPDEVILTFGVETSDKDLNTAKKLNDERVKKILALTKAFQIESKYVQTDFLDIEPRHGSSYEKREFLGYFIRKNIVITLKDITKFEDLFTGVLNAGANYVHGIRFRTTELRKYKDQARTLAIKAAREKAAALAGELGQKLGKPLNIHEDYADWFSSYGWWGSRSPNLMTQNVIQNAGGESMGAEGTIAPGQIGIKARITVVFELE